MAATSGMVLMVTTFEANFEPQLLLTVYVIVAVPPLNPLTRPLLFTVATCGLFVLQVPFDVASDNWILLPLHVLEGPDMAATAGGGVLTVSTALFDVTDPPQVPVTTTLYVPAFPVV